MIKKYINFVLENKEIDLEEIKIGDYVTCIKNYTMINFGHTDKDGKPKLNKHELDLTIGKDYRIWRISIDYLGYVIWIIPDRGGRPMNYTLDGDIFYYDKKKNAELIKKRKELKLKMKDIDPLGEEEWGD